MMQNYLHDSHYYNHAAVKHTFRWFFSSTALAAVHALTSGHLHLKALR